MQDKVFNTPIIKTKLYRPPLQADIIPRTQLLAQLEGWQQRPLTLVSAPAGYGKSMLVSSWLESLECPTAWLSLAFYSGVIRNERRFAQQILPGDPQGHTESPVGVTKKQTWLARVCFFLVIG